ncbi:MAG: hypothetical protein AAF682_11055 [Planctomycetota bacterium]
MRNVHAWKTRTPEGERREVKAHFFAKKWTLKAKVRGEESWTEYDEPLLDDLIDLRLILFNKYQRHRTAWEHVESVEKLIRERGGSWED